MTCVLIDRSDDLFELVWRGAAAGGMVPVPERLVPPPPAPPSEAEMASWLFPIVSGGVDAVVAGRRAWVDDDQMVPSSGKESSDHKLQVRGRVTTDDGREESSDTVPTICMRSS